eukprot:COSAG05_NODE_98_length_19441_cov_32.923327_7_plen_504_part_00
MVSTGIRQADCWKLGTNRARLQASLRRNAHKQAKKGAQHRSPRFLVGGRLPQDSVSARRRAMPKRRARSGERAGGAKADGPTLYCHCKTPYDDSRVMLACEICNNWFHFDCVGVEADQVKKVKNFMCRNCQADGFLGSAGEKWFLEPKPDPAAAPPKKEHPPKKKPRVAAPAPVPAPKLKPKPKPNPNPKPKAKAAPKSEPRKAAAKQPATAEDTLRGKVRAKILEALRPQGATEEAETADAAKAMDVEVAIEEELFMLCGGKGITSDYKTRARNLAFNLSDKLNLRLRHSARTGELLPSQLVRMSNADLANEQAKLERAAIAEQKVAQSKKARLKVDQATMDRDGTVHWQEAIEEDGVADNDPSQPEPAAGMQVDATEPRLEDDSMLSPGLAGSANVTAAASAGAAQAAPRTATREDVPVNGGASPVSAPASGLGGGATSTTAASAEGTSSTGGSGTAAAPLAAQEAAIIQQILSLPPEAVRNLPPAFQAQYWSLKQGQTKP